jgi:glycosyltransferase involved in cell wall biosynthesis
VNSIRVPPRDAVALRRAIERLWGDPELCSRLGAAGRRLVEERYDSYQTAQRLAMIVKQAADERAISRRV